MEGIQTLFSVFVVMFAVLGAISVLAHIYNLNNIKAKTVGQQVYMKAIMKNTITIGVGPAGTGKTYLAVAAAVARYKAWQSEKLGRDINPSKLTEMVMETGVKRVEIRQPAYTVLSDGSRGVVPDLAVIGSTTIINGGVEEE